MLKLFLILSACMLLSTVSGQCGAGEEFTTCGTACPRTCDNYDDSLICILLCVEGCFCAGDTVRASDESCVETTECQKYQCPENQSYECGTECPDTCDNYFQDRVCIESCRFGCFCKQGYVLRDESSNECVHTSECPGSRVGCRADEHYNRCGTACPTSCGNKDQAIQCIRSCEPGCFCNDGYVLYNGTCAPEFSCDSLIPRQGGTAGMEKFSVAMTLLSIIATALCLF